MVTFLSARGFDYHRGRFAEVLQRGCVAKDGDGVLPGRFQGVHGGFAVVDLEATGSSSRRNRVVEVAVVLLDAELTVEGEFSTLVDPEGPVGPTHIHGIEHHHVLAARAPRFAQIAPQLLRLLRGRVLVGHNVGCDRAFLAAEYARIGVEFPAVPEMCTMRMAALRGALPGALSLRACAEAAGVTGWSAHTALGDARATARLFTRYVTEPVERHSHARQPYAVGAVVKAAALDWPQMAAVEAPWVGRRSTEVARSRNVPAQQIVSYVGNESA
jgi:DNA polymerase-3 subunit epsilon